MHRMFPWLGDTRAFIATLLAENFRKGLELVLHSDRAPQLHISSISSFQLHMLLTAVDKTDSRHQSALGTAEYNDSFVSLAAGCPPTRRTDQEESLLVTLTKNGSHKNLHVCRLTRVLYSVKCAAWTKRSGKKGSFADMKALPR